MYDELAGHFVTGVLDLSGVFRDAKYPVYLDFAVSGSDGTGALTWTFERYDVSEGRFLADYPRAGWNADAYFVSFNMYLAQFSHVQIITIPKNSLGGTPLSDDLRGIGQSSPPPWDTHIVSFHLKSELVASPVIAAVLPDSGTAASGNTAPAPESLAPQTTTPSTVWDSVSHQPTPDLTGTAGPRSAATLAGRITDNLFGGLDSNNFWKWTP